MSKQKIDVLKYHHYLLIFTGAWLVLALVYLAAYQLFNFQMMPVGNIMLLLSAATSDYFFTKREKRVPTRKEVIRLTCYAWLIVTFFQCLTLLFLDTPIVDKLSELLSIGLLFVLVLLDLALIWFGFSMSRRQLTLKAKSENRHAQFSKSYQRTQKIKMYLWIFIGILGLSAVGIQLLIGRDIVIGLLYLLIGAIVTSIVFEHREKRMMTSQEIFQFTGYSWLIVLCVNILGIGLIDLMGLNEMKPILFPLLSKVDYSLDGMTLAFLIFILEPITLLFGYGFIRSQAWLGMKMLDLRKR